MADRLGQIAPPTSADLPPIEGGVNDRVRGLMLMARSIGGGLVLSWLFWLLVSCRLMLMANQEKP